jgi:hypothetical protein
MSEPSSSRTNELQAMSRQKLKLAVGPTARRFKLELIQKQDCQLYRDEREGNVHIVCHCPAQACKRCRTVGRMFLIPKALENMRVNILTSLSANTRLGVIT